MMLNILVNIGAGDGLSPVGRQAITWTNADLLSVETLGTNLRYHANESTPTQANLPTITAEYSTSFTCVLGSNK